MAHLVVVGGNAAGMSAATKAKRRKPDLEVTVLEAGLNASYSTCGIPYYVDGTLEDPSELLVLSAKAAQDLGIRVRTRTRATALNPYTKRISLTGPDGREDVAYDKVLLAMGCEPLNPFPGGELPGVFTVRHLADGVRIVSHVERHGKKVAVVGGGFVGLEMASAFHKRGSKVHLFQHGDRLLTSFDADMTQGLDGLLTEAGVQLHFGAEVRGFAPKEGLKEERVGRVLDKKEVEVDAAVVAVGVRPATEWAVKTGLECTREGYLIVDTQMKTNLHDVYAAGDCVAPVHMVSEKPTPVPLALPANRMGRVAGDNIAAALQNEPGSHFAGVLGTAVTQIFGVGLSQTGLTEEAAKGTDYEVETHLLEAPSKARYLPDTGDMAVKLVAEAGTGRLLGGQIVGPAEAALRINSVAVALRAKMTVRQLAEVETAYYPALGPVYDPVVNCAVQLAKKLRK
ncbi:MAG: FAD-dependent oxidoreductase [Thermoplasmatota archaeon]